MSNTRRKLVNLIKKNPELPILAVINGNICGEFRQINPIGEVKEVILDEYLISSNGTTVLKSENLSPEGVLYLFYSEEEYDALTSPEDVELAYKQLEWKRAILVHIGLIEE